MLRLRLNSFTSIVVYPIGVNMPQTLMLRRFSFGCSSTESCQVDIAPQGASCFLIVAALAFDFDNK